MCRPVCRLLRRNNPLPQIFIRQSHSHLARAWLPTALPPALAGTVAAQDADTQAPAKAKDLSTVIVTGTRSDSRTESSSLTPIDVVSARVLQPVGTNGLPTALARITPSLSFP